jgi:hypothetical protein
MLSLDIRAHRHACSPEGMGRMVLAVLMLVAMVRRSMLKRAQQGTADFDRFESHPAVVAGFVQATPNVEVQSKNNRGGRDKPGHDLGEMAVVQHDRRGERWWALNLTGIRYNIPTSCFELSQGSKQVAP